MGRNEVSKSWKMLARVLVSIYALLDGVKIRLRHSEGYQSTDKNNEIFEFIEKANPRVISEFNVVHRGILAMG